MPRPNSTVKYAVFNTGGSCIYCTCFVPYPHHHLLSVIMWNVIQSQSALSVNMLHSNPNFSFLWDRQDKIMYSMVFLLSKFYKTYFNSRKCIFSQNLLISILIGYCSYKLVVFINHQNVICNVSF